MKPPSKPSIIRTERLTLTPLRESDAAEMAPTLANHRLHEFIGGHPLTPDQLLARYTRLVAGSGNPNEIWLNWIVRRRPDNRALGTLQATLHNSDDVWTAEVAWVIGVPWQGKGFASEAAVALVDWLTQHDILQIFAHIHPAHLASEHVAFKAGLTPTEDFADGERVWRRPPRGPSRPAQLAES